LGRYPSRTRRPVSPPPRPPTTPIQTIRRSDPVDRCVRQGRNKKFSRGTLIARMNTRRKSPNDVGLASIEAACSVSKGRTSTLGSCNRSTRYPWGQGACNFLSNLRGSPCCCCQRMTSLLLVPPSASSHQQPHQQQPQRRGERDGTSFDGYYRSVQQSEFPPTRSFHRVSSTPEDEWMLCRRRWRGRLRRRRFLSSSPHRQEEPVPR